ncbi:MAG: phosphotransferase family protein, partial [Myxococcota bacterium]
MQAIDRSSLEPEWRKAFEWVEANVGPIVAGERQARWRPCGYRDVAKDGQSLPLYFRGDRGEADHGVYPLEHEMRVLQLLEEEGLPVPHVYGFCDEPRGIVMERKPGRANLATAESEQERSSVLAHYVELMAGMHAIDVDRAAEKLGLEKPTSPEQLALGDFDHWEKNYREFKLRPEPLIEFAIRWIRAHVPQGRTQVSLIHCDAGQFVFDAGRVTAILDLELAYLGDPAADFAGMLCRDLSEPLGDIRAGLRRYEEVTGRVVDLRAVYYHTIRFGMCTPMVCAHLAAEPPQSVNWPQYQAWYLVYGRVPIELIARLEGVELDPLQLPAARPTRAAPAADSLVATLAEARKAAEDSPQHYEIDTAYRLAQYLDQVERYAAAFEADDLDDVAKLLGTRPASWPDADAALEAFALEAPPERTPDILRVLHRQVL